MIRPAGAQDLPFLRDMLRHAYYARWGTEADVPLERYVAGWGRPGDEALVAIDEFQPVGAAWYRLFEQDEPGYGFVDEETPELTIAIVPSRRGRGLGEQLLSALLERARAAGYGEASLSVEPDNPAIHLYEHHGFAKVGERAGAWVMKARWPDRRSRTIRLSIDACCTACGTDERGRPEVLRRMRQRRSPPPARPAGARTRPGVKFCGECGSPLGDEAPAMPLAAPQRPSPSASSSRSSSPIWSASRRLSEERDAEDTRELLSRYFDTCRRLIELLRRDGREVHRRRGDGRLGHADGDRGRRRARGARRARPGRGGDRARRRGRRGGAPRPRRRPHRRGGRVARRRGRGDGRRRPRQHRLARSSRSPSRAPCSSARRPAARPSRPSPTRTRAATS